MSICWIHCFPVNMTPNGFDLKTLLYKYNLYYKKIIMQNTFYRNKIYLFIKKKILGVNKI